ncbi:MAG: hypothetical protein J4F42_00050 [Desulfurellaceae bacterium]|nr:hypothetical protein [Desulfurellaceae bacterium]
MREPLQAWIWIIVGVLLFFSVPYFFAGTYEPLVFGLPLWFLVCLAACGLLVAFTGYVILRRWRLADAVLEGEDDA